MNFEDFISSHSVKKELLDNQDAAKVFDFLVSPQMLNNMVVFSVIKLPVLSGIAEMLETKFGKSLDFPLSNDTNRQVVGKMIRYILDFLGYSPIKNASSSEKRLRNFSNAKMFKTSAIYEMSHEPKYQIEITLRETI